MLVRKKKKNTARGLRDQQTYYSTRVSITFGASSTGRNATGKGRMLTHAGAGEAALPRKYCCVRALRSGADCRCSSCRKGRPFSVYRKSASEGREKKKGHKGLSASLSGRERKGSFNRRARSLRAGGYVFPFEHGAAPGKSGHLVHNPQPPPAPRPRLFAFWFSWKRLLVRDPWREAIRPTRVLGARREQGNL